MSETVFLRWQAGARGATIGLRFYQKWAWLNGPQHFNGRLSDTARSLRLCRMRLMLYGRRIV